MRCRKIQWLSVTLLSLCCWVKSSEIRLGLFYGKEIQDVVFSVVDGEYILAGDGRQVAVIRKGTMFHIGIARQGLTVNDTLQNYGTFHNLEFRGVSSGNIFQLKPVFPSFPSKESDDNLLLGIKGNSIQAINLLDLEKYIPGTVESEGGSNTVPEFYKAQAVLSRTFAVKNFTRHAREGFNLCDGVHCQAYNGKSRMNAKIYDAALATRNMVLVDGEGNPIITAYHANCGGITCSASMAWNKDLPYLVAIRDPFCAGSAQHSWTRNMPADEWFAYLEKKGIPASMASQLTLTGTARQKFLDPDPHKISMSAIRDDLKLKSSFFSVQPVNGTMVFQGRGYGHGVGMCQEGAMEMARVGYTYVDILMFYFRNVKLEGR
jgi:stage II sporulation protein D